MYFIKDIYYIVKFFFRNIWPEKEDFFYFTDLKK